jgi:hypothetical protein
LKKCPPVSSSSPTVAGSCLRPSYSPSTLTWSDR